MLHCKVDGEGTFGTKPHPHFLPSPPLPCFTPPSRAHSETDSQQIPSVRYATATVMDVLQRLNGNDETATEWWRPGISYLSITRKIEPPV